MVSCSGSGAEGLAYLFSERRFARKILIFLLSAVVLTKTVHVSPFCRQYCEIKQQMRLLRPQTFIVKFLLIGTNTETGFYSRIGIKGHRPSGLKKLKTSAHVGCALNDKTRLASKGSDASK